MSLIYGVVNLRGDNIDISLFNDIKDSLPKFNYDKCDDLKKDNLLFGCNMQCITKEDRYEKIPRKNSLLNISITADVIPCFQIQERTSASLLKKFFHHKYKS